MEYRSRLPAAQVTWKDEPGSEDEKTALIYGLIRIEEEKNQWKVGQEEY